MSEHELKMARKANESQKIHTRFRRKHMRIEKAERRIKNMRVHFQNTGEVVNLYD